MSPEQIAGALLVAAAAGLASGLSGFGAGLILSAWLAPVLGAKATIPLLAVAMIVTNAGRFWAFRGAVSWRPALLLLAGCLPGAALGAALLADMGDGAADLVLGAFLVASIPLRRLLAGRRTALPPAGLVAGGAGVGVASGMTTGSGTLILPLLLGAGLAGPGLIATDTVVSMALNTGRSLAFGRFALLDAELLLTGLALGLATVPGSHAAAWVVRRTPIRLHTLLLEALVAGVGVYIVLRALGAA